MTSGSLLAAAEAFALPYYNQSGRAYHNAAHVRAMLGALEGRGVLTPTLTLAVWGHDLVYNPRAKDNEARSAAAFDAWLSGRDVSSEVRRNVQRLILATTPTPPDRPLARDEALLRDADLSIFGAPPAVYDTYEQAIRQEYRHLPQFMYRWGRRRLLRAFLDRERVYLTAEFAALEPQARANLARALDLLSGRGEPAERSTPPQPIPAPATQPQGDEPLGPGQPVPQLDDRPAAGWDTVNLPGIAGGQEEAQAEGGPDAPAGLSATGQSGLGVTPEPEPSGEPEPVRGALSASPTPAEPERRAPGGPRDPSAKV